FNIIDRRLQPGTRRRSRPVRRVERAGRRRPCYPRTRQRELVTEQRVSLVIVNPNLREFRRSRQVRRTLSNRKVRSALASPINRVSLVNMRPNFPSAPVAVLVYTVNVEFIRRP